MYINQVYPIYFLSMESIAKKRFARERAGCTPLLADFVARRPGDKLNVRIVKQRWNEMNSDRYFGTVLFV